MTTHQTPAGPRTLSINRGPLAMGLLGGAYDAGARFSDTDIRGQGAAWMRYFVDGQPNPTGWPSSRRSATC